jgi:hypothetical protein
VECVVAGIFAILKREGFREWSLGAAFLIMLYQVNDEVSSPIQHVIISLLSFMSLCHAISLQVRKHKAASQCRQFRLLETLESFWQWF